jgi:hypothetical protein
MESTTRRALQTGYLKDIRILVQIRILWGQPSLAAWQFGSATSQTQRARHGPDVLAALPATALRSQRMSREGEQLL